MTDRWIVILTAEDVPWIFGPYASERAAAKAATAWNLAHPEDPSHAYVQRLRAQRELADA